MEKAWKTKARELHFENGCSPSEVAEKVGYSLETVRKFLGRERIILGRIGEQATTRSCRTYETKKPISSKHASIGARLARYRFNQAEQMTAGRLGELLGTSRARVREMELGFHDFSLTECERISKLLDVPLPELIRA
jgi:hypothetical protein